jgi:pyruvate dehydrogenase (quinone)
MARTVGYFVLERLGVWGVRRVFGYPGDGINGLTTALGRQGKIDFIQAVHKEEAAFMASGHAKLTGEVGVCLATSGPSAIHLLNGLYDGPQAGGRDRGTIGAYGNGCPPSGPMRQEWGFS